MNTINDCEIDAKTKAITDANLSERMTATVKLDVLTEKQRDTLELALEAGYYEQPRDTSLTELSDTIGISKSAVSQRLRTAEIKLIKTALQQYI